MQGTFDEMYYMITFSTEGDYTLSSFIYPEEIRSSITSQRLISSLGKIPRIMSRYGRDSCSKNSFTWI